MGEARINKHFLHISYEENKSDGQTGVARGPGRRDLLMRWWKGSHLWEAPGELPSCPGDPEAGGFGIRELGVLEREVWVKVRGHR